jgi:DNA-binding ferritin-like protein
MFEELLAKLYSLEFYYKTAHWQSHNSIFYSDHLLFERLSESAGCYIDKVAEKAIAIVGNNAVVNLPASLKRIYTIVSKLSYENQENSKYCEDSLKLEQDLQTFIDQVKESQTTGTKGLLEEIFDDSEQRVYLLKQRLSKGIAPVPQPINIIPVK